jgi:outer membrane assembly lipoprotein YfgL
MKQRKSGRLRALGNVALLLTAFVLAGCAGPEKPKPAELGPNVALIGIKPAWSAKIGAVAFSLHPLVIGNSVYVASSDGVVTAIDVRTGADVWRLSLGTHLTAGVGSDGRTTAVVSRDNELIVLNESRELWRQKIDALTLTAPLVAGERVFVLAADRSVLAFDAVTGRKLWQQQRPGEALVLGQAGVILAVGDTLVTGTGGRLLGLNPLNGNIRWDVPVANSRGTNEVERLVDLVAGASREGTRLCVRAFQSAVGCVDAQKGTLLWTKAANGATGLSGDAITVFASESDGKLLAFRRSDGERLWVSERLRYRNLTGPLWLGKSIVVGDDAGVLHFLASSDGAPLNRFNTDGTPIVGAPVLAGQTLIAVTRGGGIFAFRPQ